MAGVRSIPVAWRTTRAKAHTTLPPPHATSSTVSSAPALAKSTTSESACSSVMPGAVEKGTACSVNWSRMAWRCWSALVMAPILARETGRGSHEPGADPRADRVHRHDHRHRHQQDGGRRRVLDHPQIGLEIEADAAGADEA